MADELHQAREQAAGRGAPISELLAAHSTDQLRRWHTDLISHIPSDPSFAAATGAVLRSIIANELAHPDRLARDKEAAEAAIAAQREREKAAKPEPDNGDDNPNAKQPGPAIPVE